ncbi:MAG: GGDEF domain-containing protein [Tindallia sp. MSAO_Bac2]|nr:MAG: GGDEF domain-containing protein [Tindallia sp. MSAO_Bac2]
MNSGRQIETELLYDHIVQNVGQQLNALDNDIPSDTDFIPFYDLHYGNLASFQIRSHFHRQFVKESALSCFDQKDKEKLLQHCRLLTEILICSHISQHQQVGLPLYVEMQADWIYDKEFVAYLTPLLTSHRQAGTIFFNIPLFSEMNFPHFSDAFRQQSFLRKDHCMFLWNYHLNEQSHLPFYRQFQSWLSIPLAVAHIDTPEALEFVRHQKITCGAGSSLHAPVKHFHQAKSYPVKAVESNYAPPAMLSSTITAGQILKTAPTVSGGSHGFRIKEIFDKEPFLEGIVVLDASRKPTGLIMREQFYRHLSRQYGYEIFMSRPIHLIMVNNPLVVHDRTPISEVGELAMRRPKERLYDYVIIESKDQFAGVVSIRELLIQISEMNVSIAKYSSPLTGLPGNKLINEELLKALSSEFSSVLYFDLDYFKAYNDLYGFEKGDQVIRLLAQIIQKNLLLNSEENAFLGHVGGDDFVVILNHHNAESFCQQIIQEFDAAVRSHYHQKDLLQGYLLSVNRKGEKEFTPLVSVSIAVLPVKKNQYQSLELLTEAAALGKKMAKAISGSSYYILTSPPGMTKERG